VIDTLFAPVGPADWTSTPILNETSGKIRYLHLIGDYQADVPLQLPSLFILKLNGSITDAANLTLPPAPRFSGLVTMNGTHYSGLIGGTVNATVHKMSYPNGAQAVTIVDGTRNVIRNVRATSSCNSAVGINGGTANEVSNCDLGAEAGRMFHARAVWCLSTQRAMVHGNHIHHAGLHSLDFDAGTQYSVAHGNLCEDNTDEGIFVEETAHHNVVSGNTCRRNGNGIGVYSLGVGPVTNNVFIGNTVTDNLRGGLTAGGLGHVANKHSGDNIFVGNIASGNKEYAFDLAHGANIGDYWVGNTDQDGTAPEYRAVPRANANTTVFDP